MSSRRQFLAGSLVTALTGLAGCLGGDTDGTTELDTLAVGGSPGRPVAVAPAGEVVLLDFWATYCAPCQPQMAELREIEESYPKLHMLSITNESDEAAVERFWREYEGTWPVAMDPDLSVNDRFDVTRIPTLLVLDAENAEVWRHSGLAEAETISDALTDAGV